VETVSGYFKTSYFSTIPYAPVKIVTGFFLNRNWCQPQQEILGHSLEMYYNVLFLFINDGLASA
jgi:hypothetical protein